MDRHYAYLRQYESSGQCELIFIITINSALPFEVRLSIPKTYTVSEFISTLQEHIKHLIISYHDSMQNDTKQREDIFVTLKKGTKSVQANTPMEKLIVPVNENLKLEVCDQIFDVVINAPLLKQIKLPSVLFANCIIQPSKFHSLFTDIQASQYFWYTSKDKVTWKKSGKGYQYSIQKEDIGCYLKLCCILYNKWKIRGPTVEIISENRVEDLTELPKRCPFEDRHLRTSRKLKGPEFRVVSYNILSDKYVNENQFDYSSPKALCIDYRKQLIWKELSGYNADVICLQEVDNQVFCKYYLNNFRSLGYGGIYNRKGNRLPEGLACFYDKSRLRKIATKHIVFSEMLKKNRMFAYLFEQMKKNKDVLELFLKQATSLQVTLFKTNQKKYLLVANTHLFYHPDADHIRLLQANMATTYLNYTKKMYSLEEMDCSVIFCGDFNSSPEKSLYTYLTAGTLKADHKDMKKISGEGKSMQLHHNFVFTSASGTPVYTNYTKDYKDCLDYIFIEKDKFTVKEIVPLASVEELKKYIGLPNEFYPSDHLALVVEVKLNV